MEFMWLYSLCQCILSVSVIVVSVRLCMAVSGSGTEANIQERTQGAGPQLGSVSCCLRLCLGWVGAVGAAVAVPVTVLLNLRTPQCLYTCITLVCCPLLVRQFTMFLLMLLTLDTHLQHHLADRYSLVMTRQRALCVVLLCWVGSVLSSFAQFIGSDVLDTWRSGGTGPGTAGLGLHGNWTTSLPHTPSPPPKYYHDRKVIGKYLPYGGFLSKFYVEDMHNFTYAEIHSSHWGVCAPDIILSPQFLVYVHGTTVFMLPLLCLLAVYLDLLCIKPRKTPFSHADPPKHDSCRVRSLALSLSLLVMLCLPLHIIHALLLFTPNTRLPAWAHAVAMFLFQLYSLVPQILFTPPKKKVGDERASFPLSVPHLPPAVAPSRGKSVRMALCEAVQAAPWSSAKHSLKAKVCPEV
ncbi:adenosine receptor A1-like [Siniperca chuatsi]|uniref:adenosine receptor A1-like n=1 Tax=Siniperca chuatsi TaxID=119488 RepID=UPI001CE0C164|nr:adenosine receptor A1-like [Siniperca chuatsi]XP_044064677.1 adenosine receptor A1-like [Siniperca chuatsi]